MRDERRFLGHHKNNCIEMAGPTKREIVEMIDRAALTKRRKSHTKAEKCPTMPKKCLKKGIKSLTKPLNCLTRHVKATPLLLVVQHATL